MGYLSWPVARDTYVSFFLRISLLLKGLGDTENGFRGFSKQLFRISTKDAHVDILCETSKEYQFFYDVLAPSLNFSRSLIVNPRRGLYLGEANIIVFSTYAVTGKLSVANACPP